MDEQPGTRTIMPPAVFAGLGEGKVAYIRAMKSEEVSGLFPEMPPIAPGVDLWALVNANGTPIMITDSREVAQANAAEHELMTVSVH